jgi:hypothetical protein
LGKNSVFIDIVSDVTYFYVHTFSCTIKEKVYLPKRLTHE